MSDEIRVALVTGGAKRVGRAVVLALAEAGFDVAFTYLRSDVEAEEVSGLVAAKGRKSIAIRADLTHPDEGTAAIYEKFIAAFPRLDVLVNSASLYQPSALGQTNTGQMRKFWAIHVESPLLLCQKFEPLLRASRGHVINMVDLLAEKPWPEYLAYCTSKAGLANLTLGLARALAPEVTVNAIAPGVVEWPKNYPVVEQEKYLKRVPLARAGTPEDVAQTVLFLGSRGTYITGQIIRLDGGRSIV
jgi:pteridine reductase